MKVKLTISYDGTAYCGWQIQPNGITVQQVIEDALEKVTGTRLKVVGSGRTDAGVHAKGQVAHFETPCDNIPADKFCFAINAHLPIDIRVLKSELVEDDFCAIRSAKRKTYAYSIYQSKIEKPLKERYAFNVERKIDVEKMKSASKVFLGEHDFKAMCASGSGAKTTVRTIFDLQIIEEDEDITILVCGNGFLYNMVRIMVGTLIEVGLGKMSIKDLENLLKSKKRNDTIRTLPAKALCLINVEY